MKYITTGRYHRNWAHYWKYFWYAPTLDSRASVPNAVSHKSLMFQSSQIKPVYSEYLDSIHQIGNIDAILWRTDSCE